MAERKIVFTTVLWLSVMQVVFLCEDGWRKHQGSCYLFLDNPESWHAAMQYCQAFNSFLLRINNEDEFQFVHGVLISMYPHANNDIRYWTAGNDIVREGHWVWSPGSEPIEYAAWGPGEPNSSGGEEDCVDLQFIAKFYMNDQACDFKNPFICEMEDKDAIVG